MKISGKIVELFEDKYSFKDKIKGDIIPSVNVNLVIEVGEAKEDVYRVKGMDFSRKVCIVFTFTNYEKKGQDINMHDKYVQLYAMSKDAIGKNMFVEVDFWIQSRMQIWKSNGKMDYKTTLKGVSVREIDGVIDVDQNTHIDEPSGLGRKEGEDNLPF